MQVVDHSLGHMASTVQDTALPFRLDREKKCRIGLMQRAAPEEGVRWFDVDSYLSLHSASAWEEGDNVHVVIERCD